MYETETPYKSLVYCPILRKPFIAFHGLHSLRYEGHGLVSCVNWFDLSQSDNRRREVCKQTAKKLVEYYLENSSNTAQNVRLKMGVFWSSKRCCLGERNPTEIIYTERPTLELSASTILYIISNYRLL